MRVNIYIDGFNLYYGLYTHNPDAVSWVKKEVRRNRKCKWLDIHSLFTELLPHDNKIHAIKYFTAFVNGQRDPLKPIRQQAYILALQRYRNVEVIFGQFKSTPNTVYPSKEIAPHVDFHRKIHFKHLKRNQLPETIPGTKIVKPGEW